MLRSTAVAFALLASLPILAQPCVGVTDDAHSNDTLGILGDEELCWDPSPTATYYVLGTMTGETVVECASTTGTRYTLPADSTCYADKIVVKACRSEEPPNTDLCSDFNILEPVEILPYACLRTNWCIFSDDDNAANDHCDACEFPCRPGAPLRLTIYPSCS